MNQSDKLNLGCGQFYKPGYLNVDWSPESSADLRHNLNQLPYPFRDEQFSLIEADHILEHLTEPLRVIKECHRILKPGGKLIIRAPHFSRGFSHPEHKSGFDVSLPYYFRPDFKGGYAGAEFRLAKMKLRWFTQPYLKKDIFPVLFYPLRLIGSVLDLLANLSPAFCSRIWVFWVGGFEEIEFCFVKPERIK